MVDWNAPEPPWEPATDILGSEDWRTPGINAENEKTEANVGKKWWEYIPTVAVGKAIGEKSEEVAKEKVIEPLGGLFIRGAFVLIGTVFITISLVMMSRSAQEGIVEGVKEGLEAA